jgi:undecaprenyl-diphosphatase
MSWFDALILGIVQGLTEFLPISSDGHLSITQKFLAWYSGRTQTGEENLFFVVMVHLGTLAAILVYYSKVGHEAIRGLLGSKDVAPGYDRVSVIRTCILAIIATIPAVFVGLLLKKKIEAAFASLTAAGVGFLITGCVLLVTTRLKGGDKGPAETTWLDALLIGIAQAFAPLPGVSRSGLTITSGLARGLSREWAVGFSLLMAVPVIAGAGVLELKDVTPAMLAPEFLWPTIFAAIVAGFVGYGAIVWLVRLARAGRLWYFSVYLFVLGIGVLILARGPDAGRQKGDTAKPASGAAVTLDR